MKIMQFLIATISLIFIGIMLASILVADIENPIKILIAFSIIIVVFILHEIRNANEQLEKLLYFIRTMYTSVEVNRLDPNDKRPAKDILSDDIKYEKDMDDLRFELAGMKIFNPVIIAAGIIIVGASAYLAYVKLRQYRHLNINGVNAKDHAAQFVVIRLIEIICRK